jgi:hypothetical protein
MSERDSDADRVFWTLLILIAVIALSLNAKGCMDKLDTNDKISDLQRRVGQLESERR